MESKKLERIILLILALLNLFLLIVVLRDYGEGRRSRRETEAALSALLSESGMEAGPGLELLQDCPPPCAVTRNLELERQRIRGLLGRNFSSLDQGGSIWFYESGRGQIVMRGTGEMTMLLTGETIMGSGDPERAAQRLFAGTDVPLFPVRAEAAGGDGKVRLCCGWNGRPVFNAALDFDFSGDRLYMVSGTMVFTEETGTETGAGMDSVSALVRFLENSSAEGIICSRLDGLTPGYYVNITMSGESELTPVWRIETDTGDFYLNAVTGRMETPV